MHTRIIELVSLAVLLFCVWDGWKQGMAGKLYHIAKYMIRIFIVMIAMPLLLPVMPQDIEAREGITFMASWVIAVFVVEIIAKIIGVVEQIPEPNRKSNLIGAILGVVYGLAILWILLLIVGSIGELKEYSVVCDWIRKSPVLMGINKINPWVYLMKGYGVPML